MLITIVFGYWSSWSIHRIGKGKYEPCNIDPHLCTHLAYALFGVDENGRILILDKCIDINLNAIGKFVALKQLNKDLKVLASIGGWNEGSEKYSAMASSPQSRAIFIDSAVTFLQLHNFDGLDLIWQYPAQRGGTDDDLDNYVELLKELQAAFKERNLLLTVAVAGAASIVDYSYNVAEMSQYVDLINVMTYDYYTPYGDIFGHNAPLYGGRHSVRASIQHWLDKGAPPSKVLMGIPFFGHTYQRPDGNDIAPGSKTAAAGKPGPYTGEAGYIGYNEICEVTNTYTHIWDASARVFYAYNDKEWLSYDNEESIEEKVEFIKYKKLAGAMVWSIDLDDFHGVSGQSHALLHAVKKALLN